MPHWWASSNEEMFGTDLGESESVTPEMVDTAAHRLPQSVRVAADAGEFTE